MSKMAIVRSFALVAMIAPAGACEDTPVDPTPTPTRTDLFFNSQLMRGGSSSRSFTTPATGEVKVFFSSLIPDTDAVISLGLGAFDGTTCTISTTVSVKGGATDAVLTTTLAAGTYCIRLWDPGVLTRTNDFSVTLNIPAS